MGVEGWRGWNLAMSVILWLSQSQLWRKGVSGHCYWHLGVEPRDALKPPTMHRLAPNDKGYQPKTLMVSALRNPNLDICSSRFLVLEEKASTHKGVT